ncbi:hypothetical protein AVEN_63394-1 [Araneus ventricosus]|uniref:Uncharacterized protein n=1 Tax=Araneus ventricosus TaxID=182803 RepID=A0A4Y2PVQ7_ARAVE|nr:hypothetical protein AVEN_171736-1 [Araneus ventricosus]GBN54327.1 hypothetical protein AVEN_188183-1 [Araneus ventricosus]GBN54418.1 hypothetical protein AVEN_37797-1 [Araneus ventricosus]GBN54425.1 hypothetical protein AVEN_63394-1 [Araneus ventricosus]
MKIRQQFPVPSNLEALKLCLHNSCCSPDFSCYSLDFSFYSPNFACYSPDFAYYSPVFSCYSPDFGGRSGLVGKLSALVPDGSRFETRQYLYLLL